MEKTSKQFIDCRKITCKDKLIDLRLSLLSLQEKVKKSRFSVIVAISGNDRPGCNEIIYVLQKWLNPRHLNFFSFDNPTREELSKPRLWRFWQALPPTGNIGIVFPDWTLHCITDRLRNTLSKKKFDVALNHILEFEKTLVANKTILLKFWLQIDKPGLKDRLRNWGKTSKKNWSFYPGFQWKWENYERGWEIVKNVLQETSIPPNFWHLIDSSESEIRNGIVLRKIIDGLSERLENDGNGKPSPSATVFSNDGVPEDYLSSIDLNLSLAKSQYEHDLPRWQVSIRRLMTEARKKGTQVILVFEGWDAAGKGGIIRRITQALDAIYYQIIPIAAPSKEELSYHYLWRFWNKLPHPGKMTIFDRSWYGRVLVERIESLATKKEWLQAFAEINEFEKQLRDSGILIIKFWIHLDKETQLRRFQKREKLSYKNFKISEEDYRNRERWQDYEVAINEMIAKTSTHAASWNLVAGNDKRWARISVLKTICKHLRSHLESNQ